MKILIGICEIGNLHLSRQINVINLLMNNHHQVVIATTKNNIIYFENKYPNFKVLEISIPCIACNLQGIDFKTSMK